MKRLMVIAVALLAFVPLRAQQPEEGVARHAVKVNLLSPIASSLDINYEYRIANRSAVAFDLGGTVLKSFGKSLTPHAVFMQAQYRFYLNSQRRNGVMPFLAAGANYTRAWEHFDCFVGNDGWDIHTRRYTQHDQRLGLSLMVGIKVNIPFGLVVESTLGLLLPPDDRDWRSPAAACEDANYLSTLCTTRIGWAF